MSVQFHLLALAAFLCLHMLLDLNSSIQLVYWCRFRCGSNVVWSFSVATPALHRTLLCVSQNLDKPVSEYLLTQFHVAAGLHACVRT